MVVGPVGLPGPCVLGVGFHDVELALTLTHRMAGITVLENQWKLPAVKIKRSFNT